MAEINRATLEKICLKLQVKKYKKNSKNFLAKESLFSLFLLRI